MMNDDIPTTSIPKQQNLPKYMEIAHYIAGGCFGVCALGSLVSLLTVGGFNFFTLLYFLLFGLAAFACLKNERRLPFMPAAFAGLTLVTFIEMIVEIIHPIKAISYGYTISNSIIFRIILTSLLFIFAYVFMLAVSLVKSENTGIAFIDSVSEKLKGNTLTLEKLWFLPAAARLAVSFVGFINIISACYCGRAFGSFGLVEVAALLFAAIWLLKPMKLIESAQQAEASRSAAEAAAGSTSVPSDEGYVDMVKHILLLLFTFGIWNFIWIYRTTGYLNRVRNTEYRNPTTKLLLCIFVPFYVIYWTYLSTQRIDRLAAESGVVSDLTTPCLIMSIFVPFAAPIVMQEKINTIISSANAPAARSADDGSSIESLKKFKDLLDNGVITQEDYDAKKKQLLGL